MRYDPTGWFRSPHLGGLICRPFSRFSLNSLLCRRERRPWGSPWRQSSVSPQTRQRGVRVPRGATAEGGSYRVHGLLRLQGLGVLDGLHLLLVLPQHPGNTSPWLHVTMVTRHHGYTPLTLSSPPVIIIVNTAFTLRSLNNHYITICQILRL